MTPEMKDNLEIRLHMERINDSILLKFFKSYLHFISINQLTADSKSIEKFIQYLDECVVKKTRGVFNNPTDQFSMLVNDKTKDHFGYIVVYKE